ncbi:MULTISPECIES: RDD family protein [unclassified Luteimonas]
MSSARAAPAGLLCRYAAWSLDMMLVALVALSICASRVRDGAARSADAFDALVRSLAESMLDMLALGGSPLELSRQWLSDPRHGAMVGELSDAVSATVLQPLLLAALLALAWFAAWEASPRQATPGKTALGLRVCTAQGGGRIGIARAAGRHLAGTLSWLTLNIGHLLALAPPQHQALHDRIAGTQVVHARAEATLPKWAQAWLALQIVAGVIAAVWLFVATQGAMQRALDALLL